MGERRKEKGSRVGNVAAFTRLARTLSAEGDEREKRELIAAFFKTLGARVGKAGGKKRENGAAVEVGLSPRERETLGHLLRGDSEKEVAGKLGVSPHTVHIYVKGIYRRLGVSSRGELMAKCLGRGGGEG